MRCIYYALYTTCYDLYELKTVTVTIKDFLFNFSIQFSQVDID